MNRSSCSLEKTGNVRRLLARWVVTGEMVLETAAHIGGGEGDTVDMVVLRDALNGSPFIPGTSLAGALRSHLADVLGGYYSKEDPGVSKLFGGIRGDDEGDQSPLIVFDAPVTHHEGVSLEIRDGVRIDPEYGVAEAHKKFDFEVIPAGTKFSIRFDLLIPEDGNESYLLSLLFATLKGLENGDIHLGKRRSRGLGRLRAGCWRIKRFDLSSKEGWISWALSNHKDPTEGRDSFPHLEDALSSEHPEISIKRFEDKRRRFVAELDLEIADELLIRSPGTGLGAPDYIHLHSAGKPVVPGTSIAGALRQHALRISSLIHRDRGSKFVEHLFGPESGESSRASRLRLSESFVDGGRGKRRWRIAIDRFTGGVIKGALFDEVVHRRGSFKLKMEIRSPSDWEIGLVLLLIRDLLRGEVPVGGSVSVGRGVLSGRAFLIFPDGQKLKIKEDLSVDGPTKLLDEKIKAFCEEDLPR